jgi:hypothetical protein
MDMTPQPVTHFNHIVIFWTAPARPEAADAIIADGNKFLKPIPGLIRPGL